MSIVLVPFNRNTGNMYGVERCVEELEWKEPNTFVSTLTLIEYRKGRTYNRSIWQDEQGVKYIIFVSEVFNAIKKGATITKQRIQGEWGYTKRGTEFSLTYISNAK
jgi:hypothetical protein